MHPLETWFWVIESHFHNLSFLFTVFGRICWWHSVGGPSKWSFHSLKLSSLGHPFRDKNEILRKNLFCSFFLYFSVVSMVRKNLKDFLNQGKGLCELFWQYSFFPLSCSNCKLNYPSFASLLSHWRSWMKLLGILFFSSSVFIYLNLI